MPVLGTKKFWIPVAGETKTQRENQILKNTGYINIQLRAVNYMSKGNFFQRVFGGHDKVALATNMRYESGTSSVEANAIQDVRTIKTDRNVNLGIQRMVATKVPATSEAIALEVKMTSVKSDRLEAKFDMLNQPEYQKALTLAPPIVGQLVTVTSLVKKLFTDSGPQNQLEASFAGVISSQSIPNPVSNSKLTAGLLLVISTDEGETFNQVDESKFDLRGDSLYYNNKLVENTFVVFNISFEEFKGDDEKSNWFRKYVAALNKLDDVLMVSSKADADKIYQEAYKLWIEGNALLEDDATYINKERVNLKKAAFALMSEKYQDVAKNVPGSSQPLSPQVLRSITGQHETLGKFISMLPKTGKPGLSKSAKKGMQKFTDAQLLVPFNKKETGVIIKALSTETEQYVEALKNANLEFKLGGYKNPKRAVKKSIKAKKQNKTV
jgi:hypothetical protein